MPSLLAHFCVLQVRVRIDFTSSHPPSYHLLHHTQTMAIKPKSSTGRPANPSQPNHLLLPPGHPVLGASSLLLLPSSSPYPVSQPVPATSTEANSAATYKACYRCRNIKPLSDFMNPRFAFVLKTCACCRQSKAEVRSHSATW